MIYLLGSELYSEYLSDMADDEKKVKWSDFNAKLCDTELFVSPIANYIYCMYLDDNSMEYNGRVFTTEKKENQDVIGMEKKKIKEWNRMVEMTKTFLDWLILNPIETIAEPSTNSNRNGYRCDGRVHCSEMNSREEARWFVRNCPGTKMDGNNDGEPCERDSRW